MAQQPLSRLSSRSFSRLAATAFAALGLSGVALATQILETANGSLTTYQAGKTGVQDAKPRAEQRGVNLEGSMREGSTFTMAIAGNPFENAWRGDATNNGIQLDTGTWSPTEIDLSFPAHGFRWNIGRTYNVRQDNSGQYDNDGYQGANWFQTSQPEIVLYDDADDELDTVYLVYGANRYADYKRTSDASSVFKGVNGAAGLFEHSTGSPDTYQLTDQNGYVFTFFGFNTSSGQADGQLWTIEDPAGNKAYVGDATTASTAVTSGFYSDGRISKAYDSADRRYTYSYTTFESVERLTEVKVETKSGGTWASPTGLAEVGKVEYDYYVASDTHGEKGDLKTVTRTMPLTDSGIDDVRVKYYRYYEGTYHSTNNPGHDHHLKLVLDYEGARNYDYSGDSTFDGDFETETTANLKPYAAAYFEYDSSHRVDEAWFSGQCGCGGAGTGTHEYSYESNGSYSDGTGYDTTWARRTILERPDGTFLTQVFDEVGQPLSRILTDDNPANTSPAPSKWVTHVTRNSSGIVTEVATPAANSTYTHSTGAITDQSAAGLIWVYDRVASGEATGYLDDRKYKTGSSGSEYFDRSHTWDVTTATATISSVSLVRPLMDGDTVYSEAITTGSSGAYETTYSYATYSGSSEPLAVESITKTNPTVSTANNGSGLSTATKTHLKKDGLADFVARTNGSDRIIEYSTHTNGQLVTKYVDADTTTLSPPSGFSHLGNPAQEDTTITYDSQGRQSTSEGPTGRVSATYYSKLADRRLVALSYPKYESGSGTYHGPVQYTVRNHAGKVEAQGVIAIDGNSTTVGQSTHVDETDDDPITAIDTGSAFGDVAKLTTSHYDDSGTRLEETRAYFSIPSTEPGTDGTHYDPTVYGYDDLGRKTRTKEAHGTITRTVYDAIGRVTARHIGTNDSSFPGGEAGTDDTVKVDETEYDSGSDDGNGHVTKRTRFVEDSATDKRETSYEHDLRGNVLLQTNPQSPHQFFQVDNLGRVTAVGGFSSTASIAVGTDDPTTETTNRIALSKSYYDQLGRTWKSTRHKIDQSDGSDDDHLTTRSWYDPLGRLVKRVGNQVEKWSYDRRDRQTHAFTLANCADDTAYADADDVTGDIVLVENQTTFDTGGDVVMRAAIERHHDDYGGSETTGALDTNADSDSAKYTASNMKGRIQIAAMWFDDLGRLEDQVRYGTYGGSDFDRDGLAVPARSDTALRTTYSYNTDGTTKEVTDPMGIVQRTEYDAQGRRTKVIANYSDGTPGGGANADEDQTIAYEYTDGLQTKITADLPAGETDQDTTYDYGTTKGASAGNSEIGTGHLLQKITYPDSTSGTDVVTFAYNAQSQQIYKKDQEGNVIETDFDTGGRETHRRVTTLDADFDGAVRRISRTYDDRGMVELVTQYDNAAVGSGSVVDEVKHSYEDWGMLSTFEQDRNSAVGASGSVDDYEVSYTYSHPAVARDTIRRETMELPSGNTITYTYRNVTGLHDEDAVRVTQIKDGATAIVTYKYNGLDNVVETTLDEPDVMSKQSGTTSGSYPDLDRFNRVVTSKWTKDLATDVNFYDVDLEYDRNSNITSAVDNVHSGFDVIYSMDDLNRLIQAEEGTKSGSSITSRTRDQQWTLTQVGNWNVDKVDLNGDGDFIDTDEVNDDRTHNDVNELTGRDTDDNGTDDFTLAYDAAGNLTDDGEDYEYEWDAFYRLRKVKNTNDQSLVAEFKYNGLGFRISIHEDTEDDGDVDSNDKWFHHAFDEKWRWVGTFREGDTDPKEEFLHHVGGLDGRGTGSYIDLVVYRDKDADTDWTSAADGTLEERIYYCQNWRADVSVLVDDAGQMLEWVKYSAYGVPLGLPGGDTDSDGDCDSTDVTQVQTWIDVPTYDVRGDLDLDGDVDATDKGAIRSQFEGSVLGRGEISRSSLENDRGSSGYPYYLTFGGYDARNRDLDSQRGRWSSRDPLGYTEGVSLVEYLKSNPTRYVDTFGLNSAAPGRGAACSAVWHIGDEEPPGCEGECAWICAKWRDEHPNGPPGETVCGSTGNKCPCVAGDADLPGIVQGLKPFSKEFEDMQNSGIPMPDEFIDDLQRCILEHEQFHAESAVGTCEVGSEFAGSTPDFTNMERLEDEKGASQAGQECLSEIDCGGDPYCAQWKHAWESRTECKLQALFGVIPPSEGCIY